MKFSIITPSSNQLPWLKRCLRSVEDQAGVGVEIEHLLQDAGTGPDLDAWVRERSRAQLVVEKDDGLYDALNRGLRRASGEVIAILNCDEQYLPGALARVAKTFLSRPGVDIVAGDSLIVDPAGSLLSFRRSTRLRPAMILTDHLYDFTCALFFHRRLIERGFLFDPGYRAVGDAEWVSRLLRNGARAAYLREYLAAFAITGDNLSQRANAEEEAARLRAVTPRWALLAAPLLRQVRHVEKLFAGGYHSGPIAYEIYVGGSDTSRTRFVCEKPQFRHPWSGSKR